ncbi:MAG TPA: glycine zipper domain-containing protein [Pyrinomonadaceae bacterium]|nr:glycine zipper domain-containing protein [Pyrinomonadaceae bacterium]
MKRILSILVLSVFLLTGLTVSFEQISPSASIIPTAEAQTATRRRRHKRSFWKRHRDKLTVAAGAATGAAIGAGVGSKRAAAIGAGAGAGAGALYTYKIRKRNRRVRRY